MTAQKFIDYLASLAPEGETALIVRQKPVLKDGKPQYYADGALKCTWPAQKPGDRLKKDGVYYGNTGSFIVDRFKDGVPSASSSNCEYVLCMMLDDIGTKSKVPPLEPTWIIETSQENYQYGYVFSEQPSKGEYTALVKAIAEAGYTDPGSTNAVRNFRIPGSKNLKPSNDGFISILRQFRPETEYTMEDIVQAFGVTPAEPDTATHRPIRIDSAGDPVLKWLNGQNLALSHVNNEGWMAVVCPNHAEHTDGQVEARYNPSARAFCCYHSHCIDLDSQIFLDWVAEHGGPEVQYGVDESAIVDTMATALSKLRPTDIFGDEAKNIVAEVERKEVGRVEKSNWYERFLYVSDGDYYFDTETRRPLSRAAFNATFKHIFCKSVHTDRKVEASICYDENREAHKVPVLYSLTYAAGEKTIVSREGDLYGNIWKDGRPAIDKSKTADVSLWLEHCQTLIPDLGELNHVLDTMAFKVQNPNIKINHAILHGGDEGCGKDTMWAPFIWAVCGPHLRNKEIMDTDSISSQWGYALESEVLIINELKEPNAADRRALANKLKPIIAAPPDMLPVNKKGLHPYMMLNRIFVLAFSNDPVPLSLPSQARRWFAIWSDAGRMPEAAAKTIWQWYNNGGFEAISAWLYQRDVSAYNPKAIPGETEFKQNIIEHGMSAAEAYVLTLIKEGTGEFARGIIASPFHRAAERLAGMAPSNIKIPQSVLLHALKEAGWKDCGRLKSSEYQTKKHVFAHPAVYAGKSKSELRNMAEEMPESALLRRVK